MDSRDSRPNPHRLNAQPWSINGPERALRFDLIIFLILEGYVYILYIIHFLCTFKQLFGYPGTICIGGPSLTFMNPNMGPEIYPVIQILGDHCQIMALQCPFIVHIDRFYIDL